MKISLESQAKLNIQEQILQGYHELTWSFILDYENEQNPFDIRKYAIRDWRSIAHRIVLSNEEIISYAMSLLTKGIKEKDALHISCAVYDICDVFLTTDRKLLNTKLNEIRVLNPIDFISEMEE